MAQPLQKYRLEISTHVRKSRRRFQVRQHQHPNYGGHGENAEQWRNPFEGASAS